MPQSPSIHDQLSASGASLGSFGPGTDGSGGDAPRIVQTFGAYEAEYAIIRKGVGLFHQPQRGIVRLTGADVKTFLHSLLTQDIKAMKGGDSRRSFALDGQGRIVADLIVHHGDSDTWLETDRCDVPTLKAWLDSRLFTEDVKIEDFSQQRVAVSLHGPQGVKLLETLGASDARRMADMPATHHVLNLRGAGVSAYRMDLCGVTGLHLFIPADRADEIFAAMAEACGGLSPDSSQKEEKSAASRGAKGDVIGRGIGWLAFNTARIEAGHAMFHIDFGSDCLPAETGLLASTTSFNKGCYIGQEIVARMRNLGHPKRVLAGIRFEDDRLPIAGSQVVEAGDDGKPTGAIVGAITSSTVSPMLGNNAVALAMMKWGKHAPGGKVRVPAEGVLVPGTVAPMRSV